MASDDPINAGNVTVSSLSGGSVGTGATASDGSYTVNVSPAAISDGFQVNVTGGTVSGQAFSDTLRAIYGPSDSKTAANVTLITTLVAAVADQQTASGLVAKRDAAIAKLVGLGVFRQSNEWSDLAPASVDLAALRQNVAATGFSKWLTQFVADVQSGNLSPASMVGFPNAVGSGGGGAGSVPAPSALTYTSPLTSTVGTAITVAPTVTGTVASYTVNPTLPAGLVLNATSGVISGTPTVAAAQATYTVTAANASGGTTFGLSLTVNPAAPTGLSYTSPVTAMVGTAIAALSPTVTGAVTNYSVTPALPAGLSLNAASGVISGTPTAAAAQATYTISATNVSGSAAFGLSLTVGTVAAAPRGLSYISPVTAIVGTAITPLAPTVTGAVTSYSVSPTLPAGLALNPSSGVIAGTPTVAATQATYMITATNGSGSTTFALSLAVNASAPKALSYPSPVTATLGSAITLSPTVTGSVTSYAVSPALPAGLVLNSLTGVISGTPTTAAAQATYIVTAANSSGSAAFALSLTVNPARPTGLSYTSPVSAVVGTAIVSLLPTVTGTTTSFSISPTLPAGLLLNPASGVISGTPTVAAAQAIYTVTATNASGSTAFGLSLTVNGAGPSGLTYPSPVQATVGTAIGSLSPTVTGTVTSYVVSPALPAGLSFNTSTGVIAGTPTVVAARATYTITAANASGSTSFGWILTVLSPPTYAVSVTVSGLTAGSSVTLLDNGKDALAFTGNTTQSFATPLVAGAAYAVTVGMQPGNERCTVNGGTGTISGATTVTVYCADLPPQTYPVSVTVAGLTAGSSVTTFDNGKDALTFTGNTTQTFATQLAAGTAYAVTVGTKPANENCTVTGGSGIVSGATSVTVSCVVLSGTYPAFAPAYPQVLSGPMIIPHPVVIPVFFSDVPDQAATVAFLQTLIASKEWSAISQYGVGAATIGTPIYISSTAPGSLTYEDIASFVASNANSWTPFNSANIFVMHYPPSTTITDAPGYAWHDSAVTSANQRVTFTVMPDYGLQSHSYVQYHELVEAATDPEPGYGYVWLDHDATAWASVAGGTELGDMCTGFSWYTDPALGYSMHGIWSDLAVSNGQAPCTSPESSDPGFGAYPVLTGTYVGGGAQGDTNASVSIAPGTSVTIPINFFSYGPLAAPITISVQQTNTNSAKSNALTLSLDQTSGSNGTVAHLTITAPSTPLSTTTTYAAFVVVATTVADSSQPSPWSVFPGLVTN